MKKLMVTGAAGFIGSHLVELLVKQGYNVKVLVRYNSKNNWGWLETSDIKDDIEVITGDVRDYDSVYKALNDCESVFHLAALIGIPYSYLSPKAYIETNVVGTYNILESARQRDIDQTIITSTSETYGTAQYTPIDEDHRLVGQSPYSASKIAADQLAISYNRSFGLPVKIVRPFNTYGPRQSARAIIPTVISQLLSSEPKLRIGNTKPTRDLTFVEDTCNGFIKIFQADNLFGEVTNIGMNQEINMADLVKTIADIMQKSYSLEVDDNRIRPSNSEVERLVCNNKKLLEHTSWNPQYTLREGLSTTIKWFTENSQLYKSGIYNV